jgi:hypothetical protein
MQEPLLSELLQLLLELLVLCLSRERLSLARLQGLELAYAARLLTDLHLERLDGLRQLGRVLLGQRAHLFLKSNLFEVDELPAQPIDALA